jgi:hypothetical protein
MMGCDIHMVVEKRWPNGIEEDRWVGLHACPWAVLEVYDGAEFRSGNACWLARSRNYRLFAALAGVRGEGPAPLGMPDDASDLAQMQAEAWAGDGHSHSWMMMSEALPLFMTHQFDSARKRLEGQDLDTTRSDALMYFGISMDEVETLDDYRLVFWFDN